ncbi:MAG TPA: ATP-binding cassette domain-containing protein [Bacteroidales bacterium]|nr:ATP-binding cassette domain-containing protein [Bacteroidales bacterium]
MSEEILRALMELFALVVKQDGGIVADERKYVIDFLTKQLAREAVEEYLALFDQHAGPISDSLVKNLPSSPSVKDSVKILSICKKINRTLNQEQKIVVLMRLYELVNADRQFTPQRMNIINTVAEVFRVSSNEFASIEQFIKNTDTAGLNNPSILILGKSNKANPLRHKMQTGYVGTHIIILRIASVDLYFLKYTSIDPLYLNGLPITENTVYTFAKGGSIKPVQGNAIYYSDISSCFHSGLHYNKISFIVENLAYRFHDGQAAVDNVSFSAEAGNLIGIMGASGSGKTTLLNIISGIQKPTSGDIRINGLKIGDPGLEGVFGFVPQDDLLIEDLTVFENLFYAACQCFGSKSPEEITTVVDRTLANLGLLEKRDLRVGSVFNKMISGGQRKRLNIALELIREPLILFVDEPTSGLSSRDSATLMDLLRELTLKGQLIFTVIHQPSSEIFKMFDKVIILDKGGCMAFFGNPVDAVVYFKTLDAQINSNIGECPSCGNVNPETIFNIIETQVVDEFGKYTEERKVKPREWADTYNSAYPFTPPQEITEKPRSNLFRPGTFRQFMIYLARDIRGKLANKQYVLLTLLEAPVLGFILSIIIRYIPDPDSDEYIFADNENIPIYIFMSLIVALFIGLTISAEEIFRDRKILKREQFLNLSRSGYLLSKVALLVIISGIQTLLFVIIGNSILEVKGMDFTYWLALFTTAFCANMIGLNISASFNSAITIYIVIPLLIIPMMVLSGAMFPFDKLNRKIGNVEKVPVIAELMPTRWTYEALIVAQFKDNRYSRIVYDREGNTYYDLQKKISEANFNTIHRIPAIRDALQTSLMEYRMDPRTTVRQEEVKLEKSPRRFTRLQLVKNEVEKLSRNPDMPDFNEPESLEPAQFNPAVGDSVSMYLDRLDRLYNRISNAASDRMDRFYNLNDTRLQKLEKQYYNHSLKEIVTKPYERKKILVYNNNLVQNTDPVYLEPAKTGFLKFRTHFFAPSKYIFGFKADTFSFNIILVLLSTVVLYITLYYNLLGRAVRFFENINFRKLSIKYPNTVFFLFLY